MNIELQMLDETLSNKNIKDMSDTIDALNINKICVLPSQVSIFRKYLSDKIKLSTMVDFPFGILSTKNRNDLVRQYIKAGVNSVEILAPSYMMINKQYIALKNDIVSNYELCLEAKVDISYVLEYRTYSYDLLYKICKILTGNNITSLYISTGHKIDDIYDHLIAIAMIQKNVSEANIVPNGHIFSKKHADLIKNTKIPTVRLHSMNSIELFLD
jgi:deoxyribose-phosphate aldolase